MGRTRLSVSLTRLVLGLALAEAAFAVAEWQLSAAKRLGLRLGESPTRRSPDTHFMRFGRSGDVASKVQTKREARASADASASPAPSLTCVPDADANGRVVCYSPFNVSRHFLLVTERAGRRRHDDEAMEVDEGGSGGGNDDDDDDGDGDGGDDRVEADVDVGDGYDDADDDGDDRTGDEDPADESPSDVRNRTSRDSIGQRFGRSAAPQAEAKEAFARFGRRRDNFMRLGRAAVEKNESPSRDLGGSRTLGKGDAAFSADDKRGSQNFIRFGREHSPSVRRQHYGDLADGSSSPRAAAPAANANANDEDGDQRTTNEWPEGRRQRDAFARLGRHGPGDMNQLRFGRSGDRIGARVARRPGNFMRLGRGGGDGGNRDDRDDRVFRRTTRRRDNFMRLGRGGGGGGGNFDLDMFRETRRRDSFLRLGRGGGDGDSRVCGLAIDALTPRLVDRLLGDDRRPHHPHHRSHFLRSAANHSTGSADGATATATATDVGDVAADAYLDSMVECLRRYARRSTTDSPVDTRPQRPPSSSTSVAANGSYRPPAWQRVYRRHHRGPYRSSGGEAGGEDDDDDDVYRIAMATAALNSRIKA